MDNNSKRNFPTQGVLSMRLIVGLYLNYLAYTLFKGRTESSMSPFALYSFIVLFVGIGLFLCVNTIKGYTKGEYIGGKADVDEEKETAETNEVSDDSDKAVDDEEN